MTFVYYCLGCCSFLHVSQYSFSFSFFFSIALFSLLPSFTVPSFSLFYFPLICLFFPFIFLPLIFFISFVSSYSFLFFPSLLSRHNILMNSLQVGILRHHKGNHLFCIPINYFPSTFIKSKAQRRRPILSTSSFVIQKSITDCLIYVLWHRQFPLLRSHYFLPSTLLNSVAQRRRLTIPLPSLVIQKLICGCLIYSDIDKHPFLHYLHLLSFNISLTSPAEASHTGSIVPRHQGIN